MGVPLTDIASWNRSLSDINGRLGAKKKVNVILVLVNTGDSSYIYPLEEKWLGGKKNDLVVIVGSTQYPKIDWVRIMSWSTREDLKVELRDAIQDLGSLDRRSEILATMEAQVNEKFVKRHWDDFKYLMSTWQPTAGILICLLILGIGGSIGVSIFFYHQDPFDQRFRRYRGY